LIYWQLYSTFLRIGAFSFGGGYAMIPLFQKEIVTLHHWVSMPEMLDMIAISQMTPGPLAINMATFAGYRTGGFWGSAAATAGIITPSAVIIIFLAALFLKYQHSPAVQGVMAGIRPAAVALIVVATISVAESALAGPIHYLVLSLAFYLLYRYNPHPILMILGAGIFGLILAL